MSAWLDELSALDGNELFELIGHLADARVNICLAAERPDFSLDRRLALANMGTDNYEVFLDVISQVARITVPLKEAQGVIWRAVYARGHAVKVPGTA